MATLSWSSAAPTVFTEVTGTFVFNDDDIRAVYIDWGDGTTPAGAFTNKKDYSNYQWYTTTEPTGSIAVTHTYTATGTFDPVVQVVNSNGFFSAYEASSSTNSDVTPYRPVAAPASYPNCVPKDGVATAVMRTQNRTIKSGIDNSLLSDENNNQGRDIWLQVAPTLSNAELAYIGRLDIDIDCVLNQTQTNYSTTSGLETQAQLGGDPINKTLSVVITGANLTGTVASALNILAAGNDGSPLASGATVQRINKVTLKNCKYTGSALTSYTENEVMNRLKVFILAKSDEDATMFLPITYITPGSPIKRANDPLRNVTLDFSQSRAKASNVSIDYYRYDIGKGWFNPADKWVSGDIGYPTLGNTSNRLKDNTKTASTTKRVAYTYICNPLGMGSKDTAAQTAFASGGNWSTDGGQDIREDQFALDDYGRFYDQYHLARVTAQPSSESGWDGVVNPSKTTGGFIPTFRITPGITWPTNGVNGNVTYPTKMIGYNATPSNIESAEARNLNFSVAGQDNVSGAKALDAYPITGVVNLSGMNAMDFKAINNSTSRNANEYLLLLLSGQSDSVFLNISNYADNIQSTTDGSAPAYGIKGVSYLKVEKSGTIHQNVHWEPLEFTDNTAVTKEYRDTSNKKYTQIKAPLSKSGSISWDIPTDWQGISLNTLCGGNFSNTYTTEGTDDIAITGTIEGTAAGGSTIGQYIVMDPNAASDTALTNALMTASNIGSFKYVFVCETSSRANLTGSVYWLSKDGANGWNGSDELYLHLGDTAIVTAPTAADTLTGSIRRVNIYDAISGFSKVYVGTTSVATTHLPMVDASGTTSSSITYPFDFPVLTSANPYGANDAGTRMEEYWQSTDRYAIKISLSGAMGGSTSNIYPEVWNITDPNVGNSVIIKQVDDSAYNLNSLAITSDIAVTRGGNYYQAITRKGKVFIARTGTPIQEMSFTSVALGDESSSTAFVDRGPSTLYGHLHTVRKLHADNVRVYWDEPQKDGTFVRFWGIITNVNEAAGMDGPKRVVSYDFNVTIEEVALIDDNYKLMTDVFPLGGVLNERDFT